MKEIPLTQGFTALVDDEDYPQLAAVKWHYYAGYARRNVPAPGGKQESVFMHRELLGLVRGDGVLGDHRNENTLDNRRDNLRRADTSQNAMNNSLGSDNTSGFKGAFWLKKNRRWMAKIKVRGQQIYLGLYDDAASAHEAYKAAALKYHKEFANGGHGSLNLKDENG